MQFEVEVKVKTIGTNSDTMRSIRQTWEFGDNPKFRLAGEAFVIEETASLLSERVRNELEGAGDYNLNENTVFPQKK